MNTNMRLVALIFMFIAPSFVAALVWDEKAKLTDFGTMNIAIVDGAEGGCWTNIGEVRSYIKDKLEVIGVIVSDNKSNLHAWIADGQATLRISVNASRINSMCFGHQEFTVGGAQRNKETGNTGMIMFSAYGGTLWNYNNLNIQLLDEAGKAIREWEDQR